jgi:hypothetical protein
MYLFFHFHGVDGIVLYDLFKVVILKSGLYHGQVMYVGKLAQMVASQDTTVPDRGW